MLEKTEKIAKHYLTIYSFIAALFSGGAYAANEYHNKFLTVKAFNESIAIQKEDRNRSDSIKEIKRLNNEIADLKIEKSYAVKSRHKKRIQALITRKETLIKNLIAGE